MRPWLLLLLPLLAAAASGVPTLAAQMYHDPRPVACSRRHLRALKRITLGAGHGTARSDVCPRLRRALALSMATAKSICGFQPSR